ncbi:MAG: Hpt domain-containing protein [Acidimicrobiales bacterium]
MSGSPAIAAAAHALKGGSATMGARRVAARCADVEDAARRGELPGPDELARVSAELQLAAAALRAEGAEAP